LIPALVEGQLDGRLLRVLWRQLGLAVDELNVRDSGGGNEFWRRAAGFNKAGRHQRVVGLVDLEQAACPLLLLKRMRPRLSEGFQLRIAVRMLESWLLADRQAMAAFLGVAIDRLPREPDLEAHPKRTLVELARRSRKRWIREALVPEGTGAAVGHTFTPVIGGFIDGQWHVSRARLNSPSLEKACVRWSAPWQPADSSTGR
jgi:hypothetical protein